MPAYRTIHKIVWRIGIATRKEESEIRRQQHVIRRLLIYELCKLLRIHHEISNKKSSCLSLLFQVWLRCEWMWIRAACPTVISLRRWKMSSGEPTTGSSASMRSSKRVSFDSSKTPSKFRLMLFSFFNFIISAATIWWIMQWQIFVIKRSDSTGKMPIEKKSLCKVIMKIAVIAHASSLSNGNCILFLKIGWPFKKVKCCWFCELLSWSCRWKIARFL